MSHKMEIKGNLFLHHLRNSFLSDRIFPAQCSRENSLKTLKMKKIVCENGSQRRIYRHVHLIDE